MKKTLLFSLTVILALTSLSSCKYIDAISGSTLVWESGSNNFFNQEPYTILDGSKYVTITGEVEKDTRLKLSKMPLRTVTVVEVRHQGHPFKGTIREEGDFSDVKPTKENPAQIAPNGAPSISEDGLDYYGTFRYDGYALCDILSTIKIDKESKEDFWPPVDLYVEVSNEAGDKAIFSWGELFYTANMYSIVIAKRVTRVLPGKTGQLWALPTQTQLVVESDLFSERNIPNPTKITVRSLKGNYVVNLDGKVFGKHPGKVEIALTRSCTEPHCSADSAAAMEEKQIGSVTESSFGSTTLLGIISEPDTTLAQMVYPNIYYGHGMGYKGHQVFRGQMLREVLAPYFSADDIKSIREGILSVSAIDGYRASFSLSELLNRNDQREVLMMHKYGNDIARRSFSVYAACDNFADRSIKGLTEIRLIMAE